MARLSMICAGRGFALAWALLGAQASWGDTSPWKGTPYTYLAQQAPVHTVLKDFAATFGARLNVPADHAGLVTGKLEASSGDEFLDRLCGSNGLQWFYARGVLHVSSLSDSERSVIRVPNNGVRSLKAALTQLGVISERFGWAELPEQDAVAVSGPAAYVAELRQVVLELFESSTRPEVMVFRLRHASAEDRTIEYRDKKIIVPGIASLLRKLAPGSASVGSRDALASSSSTGGPALASLLASAVTSGDPLSAAASAAPIAGGATRANGSSSGGATRFQTASGARVEADVRLNAVVVRDTPESMEAYAALIAQLDVATAMVEVEALIVDVSRTKLVDLGIDWSLMGRTVGVSYDKASTGAIADAFILRLGDPASNAMRLLANVRALEDRGDARVVGKPMVLTPDNVGAVIDLSQTLNVQVAGERVANLFQVTAGVQMRVTPHVISERPGEPVKISLVVDIEDGTLIDRVGVPIPVVQRSTLSTQAIIEEGQSVLIAAYNSESDSDGGKLVPGLSQLPFVGSLFRSSNKQHQQRQRLFLLTPRIAGSTGRPAAVEISGLEQPIRLRYSERLALPGAR